MKRFTKAQALLAVVLTALLVVPLGCKKQEPQAKEDTNITLGATFPLTGEVGSAGQRVRNGIELAVAEMSGRSPKSCRSAQRLPGNWAFSISS